MTLMHDICNLKDTNDKLLPVEQRGLRDGHGDDKSDEEADSPPGR